jgi:hypothetical protein
MLLVKEMPLSRYHPESVATFYCPFKSKIKDAEKQTEISFENHIGNFKFSKGKLILNKIEPLNKTLQFSVKLDFNNYPYDESFLCDKGNYYTNNGFEISSVVKDTTQGFTHLVTMKTQNYDPKVKQVKFGFAYACPKWITDTHTDEDGEPMDSTQQHQTFGLKHLLNGIAEGFYDGNGTKDSLQYSKIIELSSGDGASGSKSYSGFLWLFLLILVIVGLGVYKKNIK